MARFVLNRRLDEELQRDLRYKLALLEAGKDAEKAAKQIVQVEAYEEGDLHDSIEAVEERGEVVLRATDWKANWYEFGSANNRTVAMLRRGSIIAGLHFRASK